MKSDTRIFVGDLLRALSALGVEERDNVGRLLGFVWTEVPAVPLPQPQHIVQRPPSVPEQESPPLRKPELIEASPDLVRFRIEASTYSLSRRIPPALPLERATAKTLTLAPLFHPRWERNLLAESIYTQREEGDIDVMRAVETIARKQPLVRPPRARVRTTSRGCQLLIDTGIGMRPYTRDAEFFIRSMRRVAGKERVQVLRFVDSPLNGVQSEDGEDLFYSPPETESVVLALTDAYCGGPSSALRSGGAEHWLATAARAEATNSQLVILNPYKPERWMPILRQKLAMIYWDRSTRVGLVRRVRRDR